MISLERRTSIKHLNKTRFCDASRPGENPSKAARPKAPLADVPCFLSGRSEWPRPAAFRPSSIAGRNQTGGSNIAAPSLAKAERIADQKGSRWVNCCNAYCTSGDYERCFRSVSASTRIDFYVRAMVALKVTADFWLPLQLGFQGRLKLASNGSSRSMVQAAVPKIPAVPLTVGETARPS